MIDEGFLDWSKVISIQNDMLSDMSLKTPLKDTLTKLTDSLDKFDDNHAVSILLNSDEGLRPTAGGRVPKAWVKFIDPIPLGENHGSCGTAGFRKETVIVENIMEDPLWADSRNHQPLHGFMACWSEPIISHNGELLGTFAVYFKSPRKPKPLELDIIKSLAISVRTLVDTKRYEQELHDTIESLQQESTRRQILFDQSPDGVLVINPETAGFVEFNTAAHEQLGYSREEFAKLTISDIQAKETAQETKKRIEGVLQKGKADFETFHRTKLGEIKNIHVTAQIVDIKGTSVYHSVWRDITDRKKAEEALKNNQNFLNSIIDQSPFATWISDEKGTMIKCNSALTKLLNISEEQLIGKYNVFEDEVATEQGLLPKIRSVFEDGKTVDLSVEWDAPELGYKDSNKVYIEGTMFPIHDDKGNLTNVVDHWIDVTNRKRTEEEKAKLESRLQQAQKMEAIGTLAGGIAHDFNNILAAILGYTEMAKDDCPSGSTVAKDLTKVLIAGNRAKDLVKQILAFSRQGEAERIPIQPTIVVNEAIKMLRPSLPTTIEFNLNIAPKTGLILADPTQINQILMNLGTNAFHALEETGGKLDISLAETTLSSEDLVHELDIKPGTFIKLSVCDSGPGMTPETKEKIFDPYFTTKEIGKGTGMGLSIIHGIVKSYGGFISLYSELGEGTAFHVFIPVIEEDKLPKLETVEKIEGGKERVLFIDDEKILAEMGKDMLERLGYHVTIRKSSLEALETFQNQPDQFDIVITDQTMPGMTGVDLARRMMQIRSDIPIILCTGYSTIISEEKAKGMGIKEFALKPLAKKDIAKLIRKVLDSV